MKIVPEFLKDIHVIWRIAGITNHYRVDTLTLTRDIATL